MTLRACGRVAFALALVGAGIAALPSGPAGADTPSPQVFSYAGDGVEQTYVVPAGVTSIQVRLYGGGGGDGGTCLGCGVGGTGGLVGFGASVDIDLIGS